MAWKQISRRSFLQGTGTALALPLLEAMFPMRHALAQSITAPLRTIIVNFPYGSYKDSLMPTGSGTAYNFPSYCAALDSYKTVLTPIRRASNYWGSVDGAGDHARGDGSYLTQVHINKSETDIRAGISVDQLIANAIGNQTRVKSAYIWDGSTGGGDSGYSSIYKHMSWLNSNTPNTPLKNPQQLFDALLNGVSSTPPAGGDSATLARLKRNKSILDASVADANRMMASLGTTDKQKLDQYLTGVREVEKRISSEISNQPKPASCSPGTRPGSNLSFQTRTQLNFDLITLAMQCDSTRTFVYQMGTAGNASNFGIGISGDHHNDFSHYSGQAAIDGLLKINTWYYQQFAYFLNKLSSTADANGKSLLYNSIVSFGSEHRDGNAHDDNNLPLVIAGNARGSYTPGKFIDTGSNIPLASVWLTIMKTVGLTNTSFGEGNALGTSVIPL